MVASATKVSFIFVLVYVLEKRLCYKSRFVSRVVEDQGVCDFNGHLNIRCVSLQSIREVKVCKAFYDQKKVREKTVMLLLCCTCDKRLLSHIRDDGHYEGLYVQAMTRHETTFARAHTLCLRKSRFSWQ
jgi:hypothetical protein